MVLRGLLSAVICALSVAAVTPAGDGVGPQVGEKIPEFSLPDAFGRAHTFSSLAGPKGATIVFFRSADWCPPCKAHLIELQGHLERLRRDGLSVFAISYDSPAILAEFAKRHAITFPLLSDAGSVVIKRFGVLDAHAWEGTARYGVPYRGTIVVNRDGVVTSTVFQKTWNEHVTMASVLLGLGKGVDVPATKITAPRLAITSFTSDRAVMPGAHFTIVLDLRPESRIHIYAPGASQYLPVKLTINPRPGLIVKNAQFPASEDYFFKPLDEHVPVYQRPFRITQEVMIDPSPEAQKALSSVKSISIDGTLDYQACSDKDCFPPQRVPLSWTVNVGRLDDTRIVISGPPSS